MDAKQQIAFRDDIIREVRALIRAAIQSGGSTVASTSTASAGQTVDLSDIKLSLKELTTRTSMFKTESDQHLANYKHVVDLVDIQSQRITSIESKLTSPSDNKGVLAAAAVIDSTIAGLKSRIEAVEKAQASQNSSTTQSTSNQNATQNAQPATLIGLQAKVNGLTQRIEGLEAKSNQAPVQTTQPTDPAVIADIESLKTRVNDLDNKINTLLNLAASKQELQSVQTELNDVKSKVAALPAPSIVQPTVQPQAQQPVNPLAPTSMFQVPSHILQPTH
jgi:DNA repair exonuclease SbcCD ATPase subunit